MAEKVLREKGWGLISDVTDEMLVTHAKNHPDPDTKDSGAWLLRGSLGVDLVWRHRHKDGLLRDGYDECCPVNSRCEPVDIVVEVQRTKQEIRDAVTALWVLNGALGAVLALLDEYASAPD